MGVWHIFRDSNASDVTKSSEELDSEVVSEDSIDSAWRYNSRSTRWSQRKGGKNRRYRDDFSMLIFIHLCILHLLSLSSAALIQSTPNLVRMVKAIIFWQNLMTIPLALVVLCYGPLIVNIDQIITVPRCSRVECFVFSYAPL
jgi:hypothetical protein